MSGALVRCSCVELGGIWEVPVSYIHNHNVHTCHTLEDGLQQCNLLVNLVVEKALSGPLLLSASPAAVSHCSVNSTSACSADSLTTEYTWEFGFLPACVGL